MAIISARIVGGKQIEKALLDAFEQWTVDYIQGVYWEEQFETDRWKWTDTITKRQNPFVADAGSPRDIYDWGDLYKSGVDSYSFSLNNNGAEATWFWDARNSSGDRYAWYVHYGTKFMPDRPFTDDLVLEASFFWNGPGKSLVTMVQDHLNKLNAR
jgi:hypothetical protein